jgi:hypothetical protein
MQLADGRDIEFPNDQDLLTRACVCEQGCGDACAREHGCEMRDGRMKDGETRTKKAATEATTRMRRGECARHLCTSNGCPNETGELQSHHPLLDATLED